MTTYKISKRFEHYTYVDEIWDGILVFQWRVHALYNGGNILEFLKNNPSLRNPIFEGLDEYHKKYNYITFLDL